MEGGFIGKLIYVVPKRGIRLDNRVSREFITAEPKLGGQDHRAKIRLGFAIGVFGFKADNSAEVREEVQAQEVLAVVVFVDGNGGVFHRLVFAVYLKVFAAFRARYLNAFAARSAMFARLKTAMVGVPKIGIVK